MMGQGVFTVCILVSWMRQLKREDAPCARVACNSGPEDGVAGLVVGNRLEVHVRLAFGGLYLETWLMRC